MAPTPSSFLLPATRPASWALCRSWLAARRSSCPIQARIDGEVGLGPVGDAFGIEVTLNIALPGMEQSAADDLVAKAHQACPYSNATRGNIDVALNVEV